MAVVVNVVGAVAGLTTVSSADKGILPVASPLGGLYRCRDVLDLKHRTESPTHNTPIRIFFGSGSNLDAAHAKLEQWLLRMGKKENMHIYVDGHPSTENEQTCTLRNLARHKALLKADESVRIPGGSEYVPNKPHLAIETNLKIIKDLPVAKEGEASIVQQYLANPRVKRQTDKELTQWTEHSYTT
ncbi:hypothetical protein DFQ26_004549 [Actinomortierella ambigua]|nr:hypothetical protein DFQ26_004549 [Actinomortierella ambigua]